MKKGLSALLLASLLCASSGCQQNQKEVVNEYNIVPMPNQMTPQEGRFLCIVTSMFFAVKDLRPVDKIVIYQRFFPLSHDR